MPQTGWVGVDSHLTLSPQGSSCLGGCSRSVPWGSGLMPLVGLKGASPWGSGLVPPVVGLRKASPWGSGLAPPVVGLREASSWGSGLARLVGLREASPWGSGLMGAPPPRPCPPRGLRGAVGFQPLVSPAVGGRPPSCSLPTEPESVSPKRSCVWNAENTQAFNVVFLLLEITPETLPEMVSEMSVRGCFRRTLCSAMSCKQPTCVAVH